VLSITMTFNIPGLREAASRTRETIGDRLHQGAGGHALAWAPTLGKQLGLDVWEDDAVAMVTAARRLLLGEEPP
jgi:hypothetical protein